MNQDTKTFLDLVTKHADPSILVIDLADLAKRNAEHREARDLANPRQPVPARVEFKKLRQPTV